MTNDATTGCRIGVLHESTMMERRVALTPDGVKKLVAAGHSVAVEHGAGDSSGYLDDDYVSVGATIGERPTVCAASNVLLSVADFANDDAIDGLIPTLQSEHVLIGLIDPLWRPERAETLANSGATALGLELVPRITRAQSMDVLSSMATVAGYEAALLAASLAPRMFPMLMTAAGTVPPTRVVVLGAGVAGLQAIATAKRLGAVVEAYDVRPAAVEQIRSVGAKAIELELETADSEDAGGYAKSQSQDEATTQRRLLTPYLAEADVVITTAAIPGMKSPLLIDTAMVEAMAPGSVIIDLAAERGGNCELTTANEHIEHHGVVIVGPTDLASRSARNASQMLSTNITTLLAHLAPEGELVLDPEDEITHAMLVTSGGAVVHERVKQALESQD